MSGWWVAEYWAVSPVLLGSWVFWVILAVVLHELAHGWAAIAQGDSTPIETGHMTWNPLVHMGGWSLIAFALIGIAWGAMPVDPSRFRSRFGEAIVAAAGPLMNLILAVVSLGGLIALAWSGAGSGGGGGGGSGLPPHVAENLNLFFFAGAMLNLVLLMFNMLPVPPLDGSKVLWTFVPGYRRLWESEQAMAVGLIVFVVLFFFAGRVLFGVAGDVVMRAVALFGPGPGSP
jgi:Zn-dependent protease